MSHTYEEHLMKWEGIPLTLHLKRHFSSAIEQLYGYELVHVTVRAWEGGPTTETGFRSLFLSMQQLTEAGGLVAFVQSWLDDSARLTQWQEYLQTQQQLNLF